MFWGKTTGAAKRELHIPSYATHEWLEKRISSVEADFYRLLQTASDLLTRSCIYFTPMNLIHIGEPGDTRTQQDEFDELVRSALLHLDGVPRYGERLAHIRAASSDLQAALGAAQISAQLARLLRERKATPFMLAPLRRVGDPALRALENAAHAAQSRNPTHAQAGLQAWHEARDAGEEVGAMFPAFAAFLPADTCRLIRAALTALDVTAESAARIAIHCGEAPSLTPPRLAPITGVPRRTWSKEEQLAPLPSIMPRKR